VTYGCGGELNYNGYCNPQVDGLIDWQSAEIHPEKRKHLVWEIERMLADDGALTGRRGQMRQTATAGMRLDEGKEMSSWL
jgi:ABC-type transport system substrate-binding protein